MKKIVKFLLSVWILTGIIISFASFMGYFVITKDKGLSPETMIEAVKNKDIVNNRLTQINSKQKKKGYFKSENVASLHSETVAKERLNFNHAVMDYGIGKIYIPSSGVDVPILSGMSDTNLLAGVGTRTPDQRLGFGNFVAMSHNLDVNYEPNGPLVNLLNTDHEDAIYATDFNQMYVYSASFVGIVMEDETHFTYPPQDSQKPLLTLFRCEGPIGTPKRALMQGKFVKSYPLEKTDPDLLKAMGLITGIDEESERINYPIKMKNDLTLLEKICVYVYKTVSPNEWMFIICYCVIFILLIIGTVYVIKREANSYGILKNGK